MGSFKRVVPSASDEVSRGFTSGRSRSSRSRRPFGSDLGPEAQRWRPPGGAEDRACAYCESAFRARAGAENQRGREHPNLPQPEVAFIRPKAGPADTSYRA